MAGVVSPTGFEAFALLEHFGIEGGGLHGLDAAKAPFGIDHADEEIIFGLALRLPFALVGGE